jgi:hypothetical protein
MEDGCVAPRWRKQEAKRITFTRKSLDRSTETSGDSPSACAEGGCEDISQVEVFLCSYVVKIKLGRATGAKMLGRQGCTCMHSTTLLYYLTLPRLGLRPGYFLHFQEACIGVVQTTVPIYTRSKRLVFLHFQEVWIGVVQTTVPIQ